MYSVNSAIFSVVYWFNLGLSMSFQWRQYRTDAFGKSAFCPTIAATNVKSKHWTAKLALIRQPTREIIDVRYRS